MSNTPSLTPAITSPTPDTVEVSGVHLLLIEDDTSSDREEDKLAAYEEHVAGYVLKSRAGEDFLEVTKLLHTYWRITEFPPGEAA